MSRIMSINPYSRPLDVIEGIAKQTYQAWKDYCDEHSLKTWPEWAQDDLSVMVEENQMVDYYLQKPDLTPEDLHALNLGHWLDQRWMFGGERGNVVGGSFSTNPFLTDYDSLGDHYKHRYDLFFETIKSLTA